jgi:hypothetical protein
LVSHVDEGEEGSCSLAQCLPFFQVAMNGITRCRQKGVLFKEFSSMRLLPAATTASPLLFPVKRRPFLSTSMNGGPSSTPQRHLVLSTPPSGMILDSVEGRRCWSSSDGGDQGLHCALLNFSKVLSDFCRMCL